MVKVQGKVNKAKFAKSHGLRKSSLGTILASKNRQVMDQADTEGKAIEGRKRLKISPYDELNNCVNLWFKQMLGKKCSC